MITPAAADGFYVNLHNADHPASAIRGQLQYIDYALMLAGLGAVALMARRRRF